MNLGNVFPRNPDGTFVHKKPCQTLGCKHPNWHICLDKSEPEHYAPGPMKAPKRKMSQSQRDAIAESQRQRHAERRALTAERDNLIIKHYTEGGLGMAGIASVTGVAQSTVNKVLNRAARDGVLKIRPKNMTIARPGRMPA